MRHHGAEILASIAIVITLFLGGASDVRAADFRGVGFLGAEDNKSRVTAVSPDGTALVGYSTVGSPTSGGLELIEGSSTAFVWTWSFGTLAIPVDDQWVHPIDVSNGGSVVIGQASPLGGLPDMSPPFRWTPATGPQPFPGSHLISSADYRAFSHTPNSVSGNGRIFVGSTGFSAGVRQAFRFTDETGYEYLGFLPGAPQPNPSDLYNSPVSTAVSVSADGRTAVGFSSSGRSWAQTARPPLNGLYNGIEAFRRTEDGGIIGLGDLSGGYFSSQASAVSADGRVVVGMGSVENGSEAFRWSEQTGMIGLGYLVDTFRSSHATGVSGDGSIVVGSAVVDAVERSEGGLSWIEQISNAAFIWDAEHGMRNLKTVLETEHGLDLAGWELTSAVDISDDGLVIAGNGINSLGQEEGWVVYLNPIPEPQAIALFLLASFGIAAASRWQRR